ncbi:MAG: hypothetical protein A3D99_01235 [Candidatus Andersenbacteria bacterium RIFCSPHIGHO2_12_FULL_45_11]|uniref:V-type ATP synthase subunit E n=1 Tax=Candidatus Andersenbacteria bacterium RIFCSPHIGHO2_12_FULL_45_11 TaxID=1797281 RepID=A0A1G1WZD3_9BACT|nr:MAG: hypothetical protein A3D99_01235 [Candidatus Andersenbacteria bacterium RIFCSPHIGHO2_12_FULL_45_11]
MSLSTFKEKILGQAAADVESFVRKHTDVVRRLHDDAIRDLRALEDGIVAAAVREADVKAQSIHQQSELEGRSMVLAAKQAELIATKEAVLQVLTTLDESKKIELHTKLCALVADKRGTIVPQEDGGLVFRGDGVEVNLTLPYLVDRLFATYRSEIAKELFA